MGKNACGILPSTAALTVPPDKAFFIIDLFLYRFQHHPEAFLKEPEVIMAIGCSSDTRNVASNKLAVSC